MAYGRIKYDIFFKKIFDKFDWQITTLYPRNLGDLQDLQKKLQDEHEISLDEWLVFDVVTDTKKAAAIKKVLQHDEVKEAFEDLDLSGYTENQLREAEYLGEYGDLVERDITRALEKAEKKQQEALAKAEKKRQEALAKAKKKQEEELAKAEKKRQEDLRQQKINIAKTMLEFADLETISKTTGLSIEELIALKK